MIIPRIPSVIILMTRVPMRAQLRAVAQTLTVDSPSMLRFVPLWRCPDGDPVRGVL
jgi:hypothetical protein